MREQITITNDFHGTTTTIIPKDGRISARTVRRTRSRLCGLPGCTCGDDLGARGKQARAFIYCMNSDGSADIEACK